MIVVHGDDGPVVRAVMMTLEIAVAVSRRMRMPVAMLKRMFTDPIVQVEVSRPEEIQIHGR